MQQPVHKIAWNYKTYTYEKLMQLVKEMLMMSGGLTLTCSFFTAFSHEGVPVVQNVLAKTGRSFYISPQHIYSTNHKTAPTPAGLVFLAVVN